MAFTDATGFIRWKRLNVCLKPYIRHALVNCWSIPPQDQKQSPKCKSVMLIPLFPIFYHCCLFIVCSTRFTGHDRRRQTASNKFQTIIIKHKLSYFTLYPSIWWQVFGSGVLIRIYHAIKWHISLHHFVTRVS